MQFSSFTRTETGNIIIFDTKQPLQGVSKIKYFQDDSSGPFPKKEFRWSFNGDYWASWESLNQGNLSGITIGSNPYLFLEIRYTSSGGTVKTFTLNYNGVAQPAPSTGTCPPDSDYVQLDKSVNDEAYIASQCHPSGKIDADTLCGKGCEYYLWRPNHKGEQPIGSITDLQNILNNLASGIQNSVTSGDNVAGDGIGVFYGKTSQTLYFKRIDAGPGATITDASGVITLSVDASVINKDPSINELFDLYYGLETNLYDLSIYVDQKFIQIDNSINELYQLDASSLKGVLNIGGGTGEIFKQISGSVAELRTIASGNANVVVETVGDQIRISLDASVSGAPVWSDPDPISADVGGWVGGEDVSIGANSIEILEKMLYEYFPPNIVLNLDPLPGYYEKWNPSALSDVSVYGSFDNFDFTKVRISDVSAYATLLGGFGHVGYPNVSTGSFEFNDGGFNSNWDDIIYTVRVYNNVNLIEMQPAEASAAIQFVNPYYYGVVENTVTAANITEGDITSLTKLIVPNQTNEIDYDVSSNYVKIKFVYAYPYEYGNVRNIFDAKNDFNVTTSFDDTSVNINSTSSPTPLSYKVYIKNHWISFTPDVSIFKLIFNI